MFSLDGFKESRMPSLEAKASSLPLPLSIGTMACRILILSFFSCFYLRPSPKDDLYFADFARFVFPLRTDIKKRGTLFLLLVSRGSGLPNSPNKQSPRNKS